MVLRSSVATGLAYEGVKTAQRRKRKTELPWEPFQRVPKLWMKTDTPQGGREHGVVKWMYVKREGGRETEREGGRERV